MKNKEKIKKEIEQTFDFVRHLIDNPSELNKIPHGSEIIFIEKSEAVDTIKSKHKQPVEVKSAFEIIDKAA